MTKVRFGPRASTSLTDAATREWLVADGCGGFAMGSAAMLRTRRYHGLLVVATDPPIGRFLGLAALEPVLVIGDRRVPLGTFEWDGGVVSPSGYELISGFSIADGVPTWQFQVDDVVVETGVAMTQGRPAVGVWFRLLSSSAPVRIEIGALCTWRDVHGERLAGPAPKVDLVADGFVFEDHYRVRGPAYVPGGAWYRRVLAREEEARGLNPLEDLWHAGSFGADLTPGEVLEVAAWAGDLADPPPPVEVIVREARARARRVGLSATDKVGRLLAIAADQFVVDRRGAPTVVAGYPWFGDWSRDTMVSYEGLFLETGRGALGRDLLIAAGDQLSEGMLANTSDVGGTAYNSVDGTLWYIHAVGRHVTREHDLDLASTLLFKLDSIVAHYATGTRYSIAVDPNSGLLGAGAEGEALTWMDARIAGHPVTARAGKPVEVNALWINALGVVMELHEMLGSDPGPTQRLRERALRSFARFRQSGPDGFVGLADVLDGPGGDDTTLRPNQLLAASLPHGPLADDPKACLDVVRACAPLVTPLGLRSLDPRDESYHPYHRGGPAERDGAYHQGTVWPWLVGPYTDALRRAGEAPFDLTPLEGHVTEWGIGSVSETADGSAPHLATGCPFQAWSVAELIRARAAVHG